MSALDDFIERQSREGTKVSSGEFTLERKKALEKLGKFQLARPAAWILKIVQAAVAAGSDQLVIRQTTSDTEFEFTPQESWSVDAFEAAFYHPDAEVPPGLEHLRRGLWSVGLGSRHPFQLTPPQSLKSLIWSGAELCPVAASQPGPALKLTVSHRALSDGKGWLVLREVEATLLNHKLAGELKSHAYVCAIPLELNGRRLDGLQGCPSHGFGKNSYPLHIGWVEADSPPLAVPPATYRGYRPEKMALQSGTIFEKTSVVPSGPRSAACLVSAHLEMTSQSRRLEPRPQSSRLYWVQDGVVVDEEQLSHQGPVSCAVFASAAGLPSDLAGRLHVNSERRERRAAVVRAIRPDIDSCAVDLSTLISGQRKYAGACAALMLAGGGMLYFVSGGFFAGTAVLVSWAFRTLLEGGEPGRDLQVRLKGWVQELAAGLRS